MHALKRMLDNGNAEKWRANKEKRRAWCCMLSDVLLRGIRRVETKLSKEIKRERGGGEKERKK